MNVTKDNKSKLENIDCLNCGKKLGKELHSLSCIFYYWRKGFQNED